MKQSSRIIKQLIDHIPAGPINVDPEGKAVLPPKSDVYGSIEGTIQQFELIMSNRGLEAPIGEVYAAMEAPNGEYGFFIVSGGGRTPWRVSVRAPSFINYQTFARMLEGHQLADFVAILGSINVIAAELDR
jgi:NADH-quinone oxidoreductase subunit D